MHCVCRTDDARHAVDPRSEPSSCGGVDAGGRCRSGSRDSLSLAGQDKGVHGVCSHVMEAVVSPLQPSRSRHHGFDHGVRLPGRCAVQFEGASHHAVEHLALHMQTRGRGGHLPLHLAQLRQKLRPEAAPLIQHSLACRRRREIRRHGSISMVRALIGVLHRESNAPEARHNGILVVACDHQSQGAPQVADAEIAVAHHHREAALRRRASQVEHLHLDPELVVRCWVSSREDRVDRLRVSATQRQGRSDASIDNHLEVERQRQVLWVHCPCL
mmetsp:Transcript_4016/g.9491  ORF Transcript_4016/g.9491 Transcript_4016/m.9491 type:complete len:272 (-) Transcript_4016:221-1036(-)